MCSVTKIVSFKEVTVCTVQPSGVGRRWPAAVVAASAPGVAPLVFYDTLVLFPRLSETKLLASTTH